MKPKIKNCRYIFGVLLLGILIWVGLLVKNHLEFQHEMVQIVHSKEVEKIIEAELKELDPNALTPKGKIQSYEINDENIEMMEEEVGYFSKTMDNTEILSDYYRELSDVYEELNAEHYHELAHIEEVHQLKQKELQVVSEKYANKIAKLRKEMYVEY